MSTPVQKNQDIDDLKLHEPELASTQLEPTLAESPSTVPDANRPRHASRAPGSAPSRWQRSAQSPPTAPQVKDDHDLGSARAQAMPLRPQAAPRMPQGLGSPNIAAPSGPLPPRISHMAPPGIDGIDAGWPPPGQKATEFEGDLAIKALRQRLSLDPGLVPSPPIRKKSSSLLPALGRLSLAVLVAGLVAGGVALLSFERTDVLATFKRDAGAALAPLLASAESGVVVTPPQSVRAMPRLIVEGRQTFANEALALGV